jgi:AbrB family looped-hinge helix DNA binding protein
MPILSTTRMSTKGQIVIPENVRERLGLQAGAQFIVIGKKDTVILKAIESPSIREFNSIVTKTRQKANGSKILLI